MHFTKWDNVAHGTQFPASSGACIPGGVPSTVAAPSAVKVTNPADRALTISWAAPAAGTKNVMVELSVWHSSQHSWSRDSNEVWRSAPATANHVTVSGLMNHHTYRARVSFVGGVGASRTSAWVQHNDYTKKKH